jgi:hypothetical protein
MYIFAKNGIEYNFIFQNNINCSVNGYIEIFYNGITDTIILDKIKLGFSHISGGKKKYKIIKL